ncbi:MAG: glycosyltransferase family 4 protein [Ginsengibacter sp.]
MAHKKRIVFISHDSTLTGAPILLLNLIALVKKRDVFDIRIILFKGGILQEEFKRYGETTILRLGNYNKYKFFLWKLVPFLKYTTKVFFLRGFIKDADIIFNNTVTNGKILKAISGSSAKVVTYVHELESVINIYRKKSELTLKYSDLFVVPSQAVAQNLISNHGISKDKLCFLNYFFPFHEVNTNADAKEKARKRMSAFIDFNDTEFYIAGMGAATRRKGIDLLVGAAAILKEAAKEVHFVWIGGYDNDGMKAEIENEIAANGLKNTFSFVGQLPHSLDNLLAFDLFILPSREDPYPLVVLEAALLKLPSVIFAGTGGIGEFVSDNCGWIVDEISSRALAQKIIELKNQKEELKKRGENAYKKCIQLHTDEESIFSRFNDIIQLCAGLK